MNVVVFILMYFQVKTRIELEELASQLNIVNNTEGYIPVQNICLIILNYINSQ